MNNQSQSRRLSAILLGTLLLMAAILWSLISFLHYNPLYPVLTLEDGWDASLSGITLTNVSVSDVLREAKQNNVPDGDTVTLTRKLDNMPEDLPAPTLKFDLYYLAAEVFLDETLISDCEMEALRAGRFLNAQYAFFPVPDDYNGKTLTILLHYDNSGADYSFAAPVFGANRDVFRVHLVENAYPLFTGIFLILFGVFFLIVSLFFSALVPEIKGQISSSIMSLDMGVWIISMSRLSALFMRNDHTATVEFATYYAFVPLLYFLFRQIHQIRFRRFYTVWSLFNSFVLAALIVLHISGILHVTRLRFIFYILCYTVMTFLIIYDVVDIRARRTDLLNILQMAGPTLFCLFAFLAGTIYILTDYRRNLPPGPVSRTFFVTGCLLFVLVRFLIYLIILMTAGRNRVEFDSLTRMADLDTLSGLYNRNYSTDLLLSLNDSKRDFCLVSLDLNHLKYVNDTFGHGKGDALLIGFSSILKEAFPETATCCRVGGDEFLVFLEGKSREQVVSCLQKVTDDFSALNRTEPMIPHSVACGYAFRHELEDADAHAIYMLADQRMYENKKEQKAREGLLYLEESEPVSPATDEAFHDSPAGDVSVPQIDDARRRRLDAMFTALAQAADGAGVFLCDMKYNYSRWAKTLTDFFDMPDEYMYRARDIWEEHIHPDDRDAVHHSFEAVFSGGRDMHDMQYRALSSDGKYVVCTSRGSVIKDEKGLPDYFAGVIRNHGLQSHVDPVTGMRNQYGFVDDISELINSKIPARVMIIGIAQFNQINDVFGYTYGSRVLARVGRMIIDAAGNIGEIYRMDGPRFAILNRDCSEEDMTKIYKIIQISVKKGFAIDGKRQNLVINGGLLTVDNFRVSATTVTSCLNYAINESATKHNGDLVIFQNELADENRERLEKLNVIRSCISDNFRGFYLCYQYLVDARTEEVTGAEALLRWKNDFYGNVPPGEFVPVIEQDPLFPDLGSWIMKQAMTDGVRFLEMFPGFTMNVNLSYSQLEKFDFVNVVAETIRETGFPAEHLCLEVTESCRVLEPGRLADIITSLKTLGVRFALDDFGTGFSSLSILKHIDFDVVKIDREFVLGIEDSPMPARTISAITQLAGNYGANVCVEGVETKVAADILRNYPVKTFQGYYYAKPRPVSELFSSP